MSERPWMDMALAPKTGVPIEVLYEWSEPDDIVDTVRWEEHRSTGDGSYGAGWESLADHLPVDDPVKWRLPKAVVDLINFLDEQSGAT